MKKIALAFSCLLILVPSSFSTSISFDVGFTFSGAYDPVMSGPWIRATFNDYDGAMGAGVVDLTMEVVNLSGTEFVSEWYFNYDTGKLGTLADPTYQSGQAVSDIDIEISNSAVNPKDGFKADGDGYYDILFSFATSGAGRLTAGESSVYRFQAANLVATDFISLSEGSAMGYPTAAHIQGIVITGVSGTKSAWVTEGEEGIPEPTTVALITAGVAALASRRKRFN